MMNVPLILLIIFLFNFSDDGSPLEPVTTEDQNNASEVVV